MPNAPIFADFFVLKSIDGASVGQRPVKGRAVAIRTEERAVKVDMSIRARAECDCQPVQSPLRGWIVNERPIVASHMPVIAHFFFFENTLPPKNRVHV